MKRSVRPEPTPAAPERRVERRVVLSSLWMVVMLNLLTADLLSLFIPGAANSVADFAGDTPVALWMLGAAALIEVGILMVALSRVLKRGVNRWANIGAAMLTLTFVVGGGSTYPHHLLIAAVEVVCLLLIIWTAWTWPAPGAARWGLHVARPPEV